MPPVPCPGTMATSARSDLGVVRAGRPYLERVAARFLRIDPAEIRWDTRGFASCEHRTQQLLELHGSIFVRGFNDAAEIGVGAELTASLEAVELGERGFAYEGAAMALALLDLLLPGRAHRLQTFLEGGGGRQHVYMVHVGAGWALARLRRRPWGRLSVDPLLRWLALDGYGFHDAYFSPRRVVRELRRPARLHGGALNVFDQGVGRALWFVEGADPERIGSAVSRFADDRRGDLWSGVGLAATYAGGGPDRAFLRLLELAGAHRSDVAQGAAFAAAARLRAGNVEPHVEAATRALCGTTVEEAPATTTHTLANVAGDDAGAYERWRHGIRAELREAA
jgi:enediyne biosynthesis protein E3